MLTNTTTRSTHSPGTTIPLQPLHLKAYIRHMQTICDISGYEVMSNGKIKIFEAHYEHTIPVDGVKILRCSGIKSYDGGYLFEGDIANLILPTHTFKGAVSFINGAFVCEKGKEILHEWPNPIYISKIGNIFTSPLALQEELS